MSVARGWGWEVVSRAREGERSDGRARLPLLMSMGDKSFLFTHRPRPQTTFS